MRKRILVVSGVVFSVAAVSVSVVLAAVTGPLVQASGASPFGALGACGNFPGTIPSSGVAFENSEVEPWVVVNPTNANNIVALWQQDRWSNGGSRGNVAGVSTDGGASWSIVPIPGVTDCTGGPWERASDPWLSFGPDGTLHHMSLVFQVDSPATRPGGFGPNGMVVSKSTDGGFTWSAPITLVSETNPRILHDKNSLTADPNDANFVYAVWDRLQVTSGDAINPENLSPVGPPALGVRFGFGFKGPILFTRSADGGDTWSTPSVIYDPGANDQTIANQIVVQPDGTVYNFFSELLNIDNSDQQGAGFNFDLSYVYSDNNGASWQPNGNNSVRAIRIFISPNDVVTPDGLNPVRAASVLFDVAVDPDNGNLFLVWQDIRFNGFDEVAFSMSTDGGATWNAPIKVSQTPANANPLRQQAFLPSVEVADGVVGVTYYDFRNDDGTGELADHWFVSCDTKGLADCRDASNWGNEARLTNASFDYNQAPVANGLFLGDYVGLASDGGDFLAFFQQSSAADPADGYFRRVTP